MKEEIDMTLRKAITRAVCSIVVVGGLLFGLSTVASNEVIEKPSLGARMVKATESIKESMEFSVDNVIRENYPEIHAQIEMEKEELFQQCISAAGNGNVHAMPNIQVAEEEMDRKKWDYISNVITERIHYDRMAMQIDIYFANVGGPMQGTGWIFARESKRTGIPGALSAAIAKAESTCGQVCYNGSNTHNAWGMIGYPSGWSSWDEAITANFDFLVRHFGCPQSSFNCPGYCVPSHPWMENVNGAHRSIESYVVQVSPCVEPF